MTNTTATTYKTFGDTTLAVYQSEFDALDSPMLEDAPAIFAALKGYTALALGQMFLENKYGTAGIIIKAQDHNPLSLRPWEEDPRATKTGDVLKWDTRAKVGTIKVPPYADGAIVARDGSMMLRFPTYVAGVTEWRRRLFDDPAYKGGVYAGAKTLEDMLNIYAPPGDVHPETGADNADIGYAPTVRKQMAKYAKLEVLMPTDEPAGGVIVPEEPNVSDPKKKPVILITMGHRSDNDAGDPTEKNRTQFNAIADQKAFREAGFECLIWQQDLDGDGRPTMTTGGLDTVALGVGAWMKKRIAADPNIQIVMFDDHYNGPRSAVHCIVPDNVGLSTAYAGGSPAGDSAANNTLDATLCEQVARNIVAATGQELYSGRFGKNGVMSERETGVAIQYSARLAMFAATAPYRDNAVRMVCEHGGYADPATNDPDFFAKCADAKVAAVLKVYGLTATTGSTTTTPAPTTTPTYAKPAKIGFDAKIGSTAPYYEDENTVWWPGAIDYLSVGQTKKLQYAGVNQKEVGPPYKEGETVSLKARGVSKTDGQPWGLTTDDARVSMATLKLKL